MAGLAIILTNYSYIASTPSPLSKAKVSSQLEIKWPISFGDTKNELGIKKSLDDFLVAAGCEMTLDVQAYNMRMVDDSKTSHGFEAATIEAALFAFGSKQFKNKLFNVLVSAKGPNAQNVANTNFLNKLKNNLSGMFNCDFG